MKSAEYYHELRKEYRLRMVIEKPWYSHYRSAQHRCSLNGHYRKRGIQFLMIPEDFKFLWFRDRAYLMKQASIHRIDSKGNYELRNCMFIEMVENIAEHAVRQKNKMYCKQGHMFNEENLYRHPDGRRDCRTCRKKAKHKYRSKLKSLGLKSK